MSTWILVGLGAAAAFWAVLGIIYLATRSRRNPLHADVPAAPEGIEVRESETFLRAAEEPAFEDSAMEIAMVTMALREPVIVNAAGDGSYEAFTPDGKRARGRTPGEAARGLLN